MAMAENSTPVPAWLALFDVRLARQLALVAEMSAPAITVLGPNHWQVARADGEASVMDSEAQLPSYAGSDMLLLFGVGTGSLLDQALATTQVSITVFEPVPELVALALQQFDWRTVMATGRLRFVVYPLANAVQAELSTREYVAALIDLLHRPNSTVHTLDSGSALLHSKLFADLRAAAESTVQLVREARSHAAIPPKYDVTVISPACAIFDDLAQCFQRLGVKTQLLRVPDRVQMWTEQQRRDALLSLNAGASRLVVTRNRSLFETEYPAEPPQPEVHVRGQIVNWWWDVPNVASHVDLRYPRGTGRAFAFARDLLPLLPQSAEWLPAGARNMFVEYADVRLPAPIHNITFVGQSRLSNVMGNLNQLCGLLDSIRPTAGAKLNKEISQQRGFPAIHSLLKNRVVGIDTFIASIVPTQPTLAYYMRYLYAMAESGVFRIAAIEYLRHAGFAVDVWGDEDWVRSGVVEAKHFHGVMPVRDLPELYRESRVNLNLNFMQVSSTVNPKVLDAASCGGIVLTDYRPELEDLYPDPSCRPFSFSAIEELPERLGAILETDLTIYRQRVMEYTLRHHTLQQRARKIALQFNLPVKQY